MDFFKKIFDMLFGWLFGADNSDGERENGLIESIFDGISSIGRGIWDFFASDKISLGTKAAVGAGAAYILAPDATTKVVSKAIQGVSDTVGNAAGSAATTIWGFLKDNWMLVALGVIGFIILTDD